MTHIGDIFRTARAKKKLTTLAVASSVGCSMSHYRYIETGIIKNPGFKIVERICKRLDIPLDSVCEPCDSTK